MPTDPKFTNEEKEKLVSAFESLDVKPKLDSPEDLKQWMMAFTKGGSEASGSSQDEHNVSTGKVTHIVQSPRIAPFSGSGDGKETTYEAWKYEVNTLLGEDVYPRKEISAAAKKSLRGEAASVVRRLGLDTDLDTILRKLDSVYNTVEDSEQILSNFYSAKQAEGERVSSWACRLEDFLDRVKHHEPLSPAMMDHMLRNRFWGGLLPPLKSAARHKVDSIGEFDKLLIAIRKIENESGLLEVPKESKKTNLKMAKAESAKGDELEQLKGMVCSLSTKLDELQQAVSRPKQSQTPAQAEGGRPNWNQSGQGSYSRSRGRFRGNQRGHQNWNGGRGNSNRWNNNQQNSGADDSASQENQRPSGKVRCFRCNQEDHIAIGCRVDLGQDLNE